CGAIVRRIGIGRRGGLQKSGPSVRELVCHPTDGEGVVPVGVLAITWLFLKPWPEIDGPDGGLKPRGTEAFWVAGGSAGGAGTLDLDVELTTAAAVIEEVVDAEVAHHDGEIVFGGHARVQLFEDRRVLLGEKGEVKDLVDVAGDGAACGREV